MKKDYIIYYDRFCNLCSAIINIIKKTDKNKIFSFIPLKSNDNIECIDIVRYNTLIFQMNEKKYYRSNAILEITRIIGFPFSIITILRIIPLKIRDKIYDYIARNRYRIFGINSSCEYHDPDVN